MYGSGDAFRASIFLIFGIAIVFFTHVKGTTAFQQNLRMIPPPPNVEKFAFGYRDTVADILWLRVIQDIDVCENAKNGVAHVSGEKNDTPKCHMSWVYQMIEAITNLSPNWRLPYATGALVLSVLVDDIQGATKIFEKALAKFPGDYNISYRAAYHFLWEVKDPQRAADLLITAAKKGGPEWFYSLAGKLYSEAGQAELAKDVLEKTLKDVALEERARARIQMRLDEVNKKLQAEANKKSN